MIDLSTVDSNTVIRLGELVIFLYVSNRLLKFELRIKEAMAKAIKEGCPDKAEFAAHITEDHRFQKELLTDIAEKRADYKKQHEDHYRHAAKSSIHQESMSAETLQAMFKDVMNQFSSIRERMEQIAEMKRVRPR